MAANMNSFPIIVDQETTIFYKKAYSYQFAATLPVTSYQYTGNLPGASFVGTFLSGTGINTKGAYNMVVDGIISNVVTSTIVFTNPTAPYVAGGMCMSNADVYFCAVSGGNRVIKVPGGALPIQVFAGSGSGVFTPGIGIAAGTPNLRGICYNSNSDIFYLTNLGAIFEMTSGAAVSLLAGNTTSVGYVDATGASARFATPTGIDYDNLGNLYVADTGNNRVRKVTPAGVVTTYAGSGTTGYLDSTNPLTARFNAPNGLAVQRSTGDIYVVDEVNCCIRKITPAGVVSTFVGSNVSGYLDGTGTAARFVRPKDITYREVEQCFYVADRTRIRRVTIDGVVTTYAGNGDWSNIFGGIGQAAALPSYSITSSPVDLFSGLFATSLPNGGMNLSQALAKITGPVEVRPSGARPSGFVIAATTGNVTANVVGLLELVVEFPDSVQDGVATLYAYEAFSYVVSNMDPTLTIGVTASPEIAPFVTVNTGINTASFASIAGFNSSFSSPIPITFNALSGSTVVDSYTFSIQVNPGRFTTPLPGASNVFYVNRAITPILFQSDASLNQIYAAPSLPAGLSFVQLDISGFQYQLQGTPGVQSVSTMYNIIGRNTQTGRTVSVKNVYRVDPEQVILDLSGSSNVTNMAVGTPIDMRQVTSIISLLPYTFQYTWTTPLLPGFTLRDAGNAIVTSGFSPLDPSNTIRLVGTPTLAAAQYLAATSNAYTFTLNGRLTRGINTLTSSIPFTFSFGETVLFTQQPSNVTLYDGDTVDSNNGYAFNARTFFTPGTVGISNIFSPDLRSDLSLQFVGGSPVATAYLVGTSTFSAPSQSYTVRAVNSNGLTRDTSFFLLTEPDVVTFTPPTDLCSTFIFSRPLGNAKTGYYNSPISFRAAASSGNLITYTDGTTLVGTGLSLSNVSSNNSVRLVGTPLATLSPTTLTITGTAAQSGAFASTSVQISIVPDTATWTVTPTTPSEFIQNEESVPYQFRATTLSELPVSYYSGSNLPLGLSLSSTGRLTGTPTTPGSGVATVTANTGYSTLSTTFAYTVLPDAILFSIPPPISREVVPNQEIDPIQISGLSYTGVVASNYALDVGEHATFGISVTSNGLIYGTLVDQSDPFLLYPRESLRYTISAVAGNVGGSFDFFLETDGASRLNTIASTYDASLNATNLYYTNRASLPVWDTVRPAGTYWYNSLTVSDSKPTYLLTVGDSLSGQQASNAVTNVYLSNGFGCLNYYTSNAFEYSNIYSPNVGTVGTMVYSAAKNYSTTSEVYAIGRWYDFFTATAVTQSPAFVVSTDDGQTFDNFTAAFIDSTTISDGTNFYASSNAPNGEGIVLAHVSSNVPIVGGAADASGNHSILYGIPQTSIYDICWNPVTNEFLTITTDIRGHFRQDLIPSQYQNVYFLGSDAYDPYDPSWVYIGPAQTIKYAPISGGVVSNVLSNAPTGFNVVGLRLYGFLEANETELWATGISYNGTGFIPELRTLAPDGLNWLVVDLSTNPLFTPSLSTPSLDTGYGPVFFSGPENPVDTPTTYVVVRRNGTTELYTKRTPTSDWTRADPFPFSGSQAALLPETGMAYQFETPKVSLTFPNQGGTAFPPQETHYLLYQYAYTSITIVPPTPEPTNPYLYVRDEDLPPGLRFNALTGVISGYPTTLLANQAVTVYALQRTSQLVSFFTLYITVVNPFVVRPQMSAASYTALLRQYTLANAAQNARDSRVFAGAERTQGAFGAGEGTDVITQVNTGCDPNCPPIVIPTIPFSPLDVEGCRLWLDATDSVITPFEGNDVIRWNDKSGYANNATDISGSPILQTNGINGHPAVYFDGDSLYGPLVNTGVYTTSFAVFKTNPTLTVIGGYYPVVSTADVLTKANFVPLAVSSSVGADSLLTRRNGITTTGYVGDATPPTLLETSYDGTFSYLRVNSSPVGSSQIIGGNFSYTRYGLAGNAGTPSPAVPSGPWKGYLGEVIIYHSVLTTSDRQKVEGYLAWKWGLESNLPSNHPYKNAPP